MTITMNAFRMSRAGRAAALAAAAMLALAGCAAEQVEAEETTVPVSTTEAPTATPMFASDEEALAAGVAAAQAAIDAEVANIGRPADPTEAFKAVTTGEYFEELMQDHERVRQRGYVYEGHALIEPISLQRNSAGGEGAEIVFYACLDRSGARRVDGAGNTVAQENTVMRTQLEVRVVGQSDALKVESMDRWSSEPC